MTDIIPNPRNCNSCKFMQNNVCVVPLPKTVLPTTPELLRIEDGLRDAPCDAFKPIAGTYARICLNCGKPIRTGHKYTNIGLKQWVHKYCDHPESPSKYHWDRYGSKW